MHDTFAEHQLNGHDPRNQFRGYPIISDQVSREGLSVIWRELEKVLAAEVAGDVVEFGCYAGTTSLFIRRLLNQYPTIRRQFHVYDSFEGLPEKSRQDANAAGVDFAAGKLYVSRTDFNKVFQRAGLLLPVVHKNWFHKLSAIDIPQHIAFGFLDGDFYQSIMDSLRLVWPRLSKKGIICIDDYQRETLPGVEQAVRDFFGANMPAIRVEHNIAVISKQTWT